MRRLSSRERTNGGRRSRALLTLSPERTRGEPAAAAGAGAACSGASAAYTEEAKGAGDQREGEREAELLWSCGDFVELRDIAAIFKENG